MAVYRASIHALAATFYTAEQLEAWAPQKMDARRWQERLAKVHTIVTEHEGTLTGFASYETNGHLDLLFTHPAFARQGVATRLCRRVEAAMIGAGVSRIFTEASLAARPFFEHRGFVVDHEELVECQGAHLRRFAMHKNL